MAQELGWPLPKPLEGVKSRKRRIFKADSVQLQLGNGQVLLASELSLTLESRIAAVGEAGRAAVKAWLLGATESQGQAQEIPCGVSRHEGLIVAHLGPGRLGSGNASAIAAELAEQCPHVVVLDEALDVGDAAWSQTFMEILHGEALRAFRGAVVVCAAEASRCLAQVCRLFWTTVEGRLCPEPFVEVIYNALDPEVAAEDLLEQALAIKDMDVAHWVNKSRELDWNITLFIENGQLAGLLCHHMIESLAEFKVELVVVPSWLRGGGHGTRMVRWVIDRAARMPPSQCRWISLNALDSRVSFYEQFGFVDLGSSDSKHEDTTWMELRNVSLLPEEA